MNIEQNIIPASNSIRDLWISFCMQNSFCLRCSGICIQSISC